MMEGGAQRRRASLTIKAMFENRLEEVLPAYRFWYRLANSAVLALAVVAIWLFIGMLGYHFVAGLPWIDAFLNAAMILSGMGRLMRCAGMPPNFSPGLTRS